LQIKKEGERVLRGREKKGCLRERNNNLLFLSNKKERKGKENRLSFGKSGRTNQ
jgi:hypothetical protein